MNICQCSKSFEPKKPNQKHCSNACRQKAYRQSKGKSAVSLRNETGVTAVSERQYTELMRRITAVEKNQKEIIEFMKETIVPDAKALQSLTFAFQEMQAQLQNTFSKRANGIATQAGWR